MKKSPDKIRIAVLIDAWFPFQGGGQVHVRETVSHLHQKHNCQITIFHGFLSNLPARLIWNLFVIPQVIFRHLNKPFNLIHAHAYSAGLSGKILSLILDIPVIFTVHGSNTLDIFNNRILRGSLNASSFSWQFKYWLEKWLLSGIKYDAQISVASNFLKYSNINKKIYIIPNGVDINKFKVQSSYLRRQTKFKVKKKKQGIKYRLLFVGRLERIKGVDVLLKALARIKNQLPGFELRVIGKGVEESNLRGLSNELELNNNVFFMGEIKGKELINEYLEADLFVLPSLTEGQPLTLLEAWAARLPVLVTNVGDNSQLVKNGKNGFLVEPGKTIALANSLLEAFKQMRKWSRLGEEGFLLVKNQYTWEKVAKKTHQLYQNLIN
ncbi:hypothetical protein A2160_02805 [Candidatus Beckwithbacteria bacterium RBG_13_42_9]|uniref:Glycosyltransferase subfamily 4-like N-terminal domain-containing protein n=1 Tax=Candidatus Beckwithbacteria bacterium RBG_13_42_9 TaxID=1797457 RepID=A0A1F5E7V8_9BACT|nr:MAG: hypothetical protein A2160_02805 [Candidatus Beckwithbacteria bacterium RBG_13_42_9]